MTLVGLSILQLLACAAALGGAVILIYLLKLKRRGLLVSSSLLWREVLSQQRAESLIERLRWWFSLILQIVFVCLVLLAIAQPKLSRGVTDEQWSVMILDSTASMLAHAAKGSRQTRFELAQTAAANVANHLPGTESVMLMRLGGANEVLSPFSQERTQLQSAINNAQPTEGPGDIRQALMLANSALAGKPNPHIVLITDGAISADSLNASQIKPSLLTVAAPVDNVGITAISVQQQYLDSPDYQLFVEVTNFGQTGRSLNAKLYQQGELIDTRPLDLGPRSSVQKVFTDFDQKGGPVRVELDVDDALALDNQAFAYLPPRRQLKGTLVSDGNLFLESALKADPSIDLKTVSPSQFDQNAATDFIVFDGAAPQYTGTANTLYLNPSGPFSPVSYNGELNQVAVSTYNSQHPLMRFINFKDLTIKHAQRLRAAPGDTVLARAGADPVVLSRESSGRKTVVIAFDIFDSRDSKATERSDLPLRAAFPILIANAVHWFANERPIEATMMAIGQPIDPTLTPGGQTTVTRLDPATNEPIQADGSAPFAQSGIYQVKSGDDSRFVAVNLISASESDLNPPDASGEDSAGQTTDKFDVSRSSSFTQPAWLYLIIVGLAIVFLEWFTYQRRITV